MLTATPALPTAPAHRANIVLGPLVVDAQAATAAILSGVALTGRILMVLAAGSASALQLSVVLVIGAVACLIGTKASAEPSLRGFSRLLARVGQRAGAVQVVLSLFFLATLIA